SASSYVLKAASSVGVRVLLRQPHGFEGLVTSFVLAVTNHLRITEVIDTKEVALRATAAVPSNPTLAEHDHDRTAGIDVFAGLHLVVRPGSQPLAEESFDPLGAAV